MSKLTHKINVHFQHSKQKKMALDRTECIKVIGYCFFIGALLVFPLCISVFDLFKTITYYVFCGIYVFPLCIYWKYQRRTWMLQTENIQLHVLIKWYKSINKNLHAVNNRLYHALKKTSVPVAECYYINPEKNMRLTDSEHNAENKLQQNESTFSIEESTAPPSYDVIMMEPAALPETL